MQGSPIIVTRPLHQAQLMQIKLAELGLRPIVFPLFEIEANLDNAALDAALQNLSFFSLVVFVSPNAIDAAFTRLASASLRWPVGLAIGVMGAASRQALLKYGLHAENAVIISPTNSERTDSETLFDELDLVALRGKKVLIVRGDSGREFLAEALMNNQIVVQQVSAYRRVMPDFDQDRQQQLQVLLTQSCKWIITSSAGLKNLLMWCLQLDLPDAVVKMQQQHLFVPHFRIAEVARELGFEHVSLTASGDEKLLLALQSYL